MMIWLNKKMVLGLSLVESFLLLAIITLPFDNNLNSYCIVLFSILALISTGWKEKKERLGGNRLWIFPLVYFLWMALSMFWDASDQSSGKFIEKAASFIAFPLLLGSMQKMKAGTVRVLLFSFAISVITAAIYCLWQAWQDYLTPAHFHVFFYHYLSMQLKLNAIYFSMYTLFSILILIYYAFFEGRSRALRWMVVLPVLFLTGFIILLSSKMQLFLLVVGLLCLLTYAYFSFRSSRKLMIILFLFLLALPVFSLQLPYIKSRIDDTKWEQYKGAEDNFNGLAVRSLLWKLSWKLILEEPLIGHGHARGQELLNAEYAKAGFLVGVKENFNSHNQYLYTWLNYGLVGLLLISAYLILFTIRCIRQKNVLGVLLGIVFLISNITESMLEAQKGIAFYMLFSILFLFHHTKEKNQTGKGTSGEMAS